MRRLADERELPTIVFTFPVHPRFVLQTQYRPKLLNTLDEKLALLDKTGIDYCAVIDFTPELAARSASDFIVHTLSEEWGVKCLLIGYDHRFGHQRQDGFEQYMEYGKTCGMEVLHSTPFKLNNQIVSSSKIRQLLTECRVDEAARMLTYPYSLSGVVVSGQQRGRTLGFPTANMEMNDPLKVWPGMGVYAVRAYIDGVRHKGMLAIGNRPTLDGEEITIEVHLLNFSSMIYGAHIEVEFKYYLRDNKKFDNVEALKRQLKLDCLMTAELLQ
jgi:riboflavin kinase/FMN adenylyltransferase